MVRAIQASSDQPRSSTKPRCPTGPRSTNATSTSSCRSTPGPVRDGRRGDRGRRRNRPLAAVHLVPTAPRRPHRVRRRRRPVAAARHAPQSPRRQAAHRRSSSPRSSVAAASRCQSWSGGGSPPSPVTARSEHLTQQLGLRVEREVEGLHGYVRGPSDVRHRRARVARCGEAAVSGVEHATSGRCSLLFPPAIRLDRACDTRTVRWMETSTPQASPERATTRSGMAPPTSTTPMDDLLDAGKGPELSTISSMSGGSVTNRWLRLEGHLTAVRPARSTSSPDVRRRLGGRRST